MFFANPFLDLITSFNQLSDTIGANTNVSSTLLRNSNLSSWLSSNDLHNEFDFGWGQVVESVPYLNNYLVNRGMRSFIWCSDSSIGGYQPSGVRNLSGIPIGSYVYFMSKKDMPTYGCIIAVEPQPISTGQTFRPDYICQGSRVGFFSNPTYNYHVDIPDSAGTLNWSCGRPIDQINGGEWGKFTETGLALFIDSYMTYLRASEETGLFLFYMDQLARLAGHNLQIRTGMSEKEYLNDESEFIKFAGESMYPWERMGFLKQLAYLSSTQLTREYSRTTENDFKSNMEYGNLEPAYDDQQPIYRWQTYGGYLGQPYKEILSGLPLDGTTNSGINRYGTDKVFPGLYEKSVMLDGTLAVRSAKKIILVKQPIIPVPKQRIRPESPNGDNQDNYKASGIDWDTFSGDYTITGDVDLSDTFYTDNSAQQTPQIKANAIIDRINYLFNYKSVLPFYKHPLDWYTPEQNIEFGSDRYYAGESNQKAINYSYLQTNQFLPLPEFTEYTVDHRYGNQKYFQNTSYINMDDDGSICIGDGSGGEIKMVGGSIYISCPGDIWLQSGKNIINWAGRDYIMKAYNSADLSTTKRDFRIKAEHNFQLVAGNDTCGGVLIESKALCEAHDFSQPGEAAIHTGIILKSPYASMTISNGIKQASQGYDYIVDVGENTLRYKAKYIERFIKESAFDFFTDDTDTVIKQIEWQKDASTVGMPFRVFGNVHIDGCMWINHWISIIDGHIASSKTSDFGGAVVDLGTDPETNYGDALMIYLDLRNADVIDFGNLENQLIILDSSTSEIIADAHFSFRTVAQYITSNFYLYECRWQKLEAEHGSPSGLPSWTENYVETPVTGNEHSYPYPGEIFYSSTNRFLFVRALTNGLEFAPARTDVLYTNPYGAPSSTNLEDYLIINDI